MNLNPLGRIKKLEHDFAMLAGALKEIHRELFAVITKLSLDTDEIADIKSRSGKEFAKYIAREGIILANKAIEVSESDAERERLMKSRETFKKLLEEHAD